MTREEIKNIVRHVFHFYEVNAENCNWTDMNEACGEIFKALEQEPCKPMIKRIELPTVSDILREEFMEPFGISAYRLAKDINVPVSRIQAILNGNRKITIDTSIRLGRYFGVSYEYFLNIQNAIDIREASDNMAEDIKSIKELMYN